MDLGFGAFLEKFEEHFGKPATKWFLILIGLAVGALCLGAIWQWFIGPVLAFFESPARWNMAIKLFLIFFAAGAGIALGSSFVTLFRGWRLIREAEGRYVEVKAKSDALIERGQIMTSEARELLRNAEATYQEARQTYETAEVVLKRANNRAKKAKRDTGEA